MRVLRWKRAMTTNYSCVPPTPLLPNPPHMHGPSSKSLHCKPHPQCVPRHTGGSLCHQQTRAGRAQTLPECQIAALVWKAQVAQYDDLAFRLKTDKGRAIVLRLRKSGLFLPEAKEILFAHQDLEDAGCSVNYHSGKMRVPGGHVLTMVKSVVV